LICYLGFFECKGRSGQRELQMRLDHYSVLTGEMQKSFVEDEDT
jgi:hypothetical protein